MSAAVFEHGVPWTEADFLALGQTSDRVELFDGSLLVTPAPTPHHQRVSHRLCNALERSAEAAGLEVYQAVNVRLKLDRIPIPDLVIVEPIDSGQPVIEAKAVRLICEIVSPSNAATDRVLKMHYYAEAASRTTCWSSRSHVGCGCSVSTERITRSTARPTWAWC